MVSLTKIYTRTGDSGETAIGDGQRVSKLNARIIAGGAVDEANSFIGLALSCCECDTVRQIFINVQQRLFDLGADITCPWLPDDAEDRSPRMTEFHIKWLEEQIDLLNGELSDLKSFILPGGRPDAAAFHTARSICRRAEIDVLKLAEDESINPQIAVYLNRLSDLLFVAARYTNSKGADDVLWQPDSQ